MFSINTNIASLQAQDYLRKTQNFQSLTINRVTSGLRIVNSGDDAAGLAIANTDRSDEAVLKQGIQNANNGLSQLQIADGGISNISQLLDRARTLATQSASGAFTGDRSVLNAEFQNVIQEVNRQAQAIGLNQGGTFAKDLQVFIGGGKTSGAITGTKNGTVSVNLSDSTVDAKSLGLAGVQAAGNATTDIGTGSATSVQNILANPTNQGSISNNTTAFYFTGPGFSDTSGNNVVKVAVNLTGVTDTATLVTAINQAIQNAGNGASQQATAFKNANVTSAINTDATGKQQLVFSSGSTAFQVQGGDQVATSLLGNFSSGTTGNSANVTALAAHNYVAPAGAENGIQLQIAGAGLNGSAGDITVNLGAAATIAAAVQAINTGIAANAALSATGIQAVVSGSKIALVGHAGQSFSAQASGDATGALGFGSFQSSAGAFNYSTITAATAFASVTAAQGTNQDVQFSVNGGTTVDLGTVIGGYTAAGDDTAAVANLNASFQGNATARAAGLQATLVGGKIVVSSLISENFRVNFVGANNAFGFGTSGVNSLSASAVSSYVAPTSNDALGSQSSVNGTNADPYAFTGLNNAGDAQTVTLSVVDAQGNQHSLNVGLTAANAGNLDQVLSTINSAIQASNDSTLKGIAAFKEVGTAGQVNGVEGIRFLSAGSTFKVSLGASPSNVGIADGATGSTGGAVFTSAANGVGSTADITNVATATAAVDSLANAVARLGNAQASVGRGENQFNYAVNLANSQLTNLAAAESGIRDADLATESANLTKAQIQLQAGIAALAQANSAPQQVLSLLKG